MTAPRASDALPRRAHDPGAPPERLLLVLRHTDGRYLLVRRPGADHPGLLATDAPHPEEGFAAGLVRLVDARLDVRVVGEPRLAPERIPARLRHPYTGSPTLGWLRAVAISVEGEPTPDPLLAGVDLLPHSEAETALPTHVERRALRLAAALLE